jgi:hypothetical protein
MLAVFTNDVSPNGVHLILGWIARTVEDIDPEFVPRPPNGGSEGLFTDFPLNCSGVPGLDSKPERIAITHLQLTLNHLSDDILWLGVPANCVDEKKEANKVGQV